MPKTRYQHLFFDLDHTLWDGHLSATQSITQLYDAYQLQAVGVPSADDLVAAFHLINYRLWEQFEQGVISFDQLKNSRFMLLLATFGIEQPALAQQLADHYRQLQDTAQLYLPHTHEVLNYLHQQAYQLHIFTNGLDPAMVAQKIQPIRHYFTHIIGSYTSGYFKPHCAAFAAALSIAQATPHQSLMIGDSQHTDIIGAAQAQIDTVWLNQRPQTLLHTPNFEITDLEELLHFL